MHPCSVGVAHVDEHLRERIDLGRKLVQRTLLGNERAQQERGQHAIAGAGVAGCNDVSGLLTAQGVTTFAHGLQDVPVAHRCLNDVDVRRTHGAVQADV